MSFASYIHRYNRTIAMPIIGVTVNLQIHAYDVYDVDAIRPKSIKSN